MMRGFVCALLLLGAGAAQAVSLAPGDLLVTDLTQRALFRIDPTTGDRTVVSGCANASCSSIVGSGDAFFSPSGVAYGASDGTSGPIYVTDTITDSLIRVDPATGNRTVVSSLATGSGPSFVSPLDVALHPSGDLVVVDESLSAVFLVDPITHDRTILSGCHDIACTTFTGSGTAFGDPHDLFIDGNGDVLLLDAALDAVMSIDFLSGDRSVLSSASVGSGTSFISPRNITVDAAGYILISDSNLSETLPGLVFKVDPVTGDRTVIASGSIGAGRDLEVPVGLAVDDAGDIIVLDFLPGIVLSVDPVTGDRTVLSSSQTGSGLTLQAPTSIAVVPIPEPGTALLLGIGLALLGRRRR